MTNQKEKSGVPDGKQLEIIDPLGEIQSVAKELWQKDGRPSGKDWRDYWSAAERLLLAGRSEGPATDRARSSTPRGPQAPPPEAVRRWIEQDDRPLLSLLASAFKRTLTAEEAKSLAHVLGTHTIRLHNGSTLGPCDQRQIAELLADLAGEYDEDLLRSIQAAPEERKREYWLQRLRSWEQEDRPLPNVERNLIARLRNEIAAETRVQELTFTAPGAQLG